MYTNCDLYGGEGCEDVPVTLIILIAVAVGVFLIFNRKKLVSHERGELLKVISILVLVAAISLLVPLLF
jgi:hypothetical protein